MRVDVSFSINVDSKPSNYAARLPAKAFQKCYMLAYEAGGTRYPLTDDSINISPILPEGHPAVKMILEICEAHGWRPHYGYICSQDPERFPVSRIRRYDPSDRSADYYHSMCFPNDLHNGYFERDDWVATASTSQRAAYPPAASTAMELQYRQADIDAMPPFDLAYTLEDLGNPEIPEIGKHRLVISRRTRETLNALGLKKLNFDPVRLIE